MSLCLTLSATFSAQSQVKLQSHSDSVQQMYLTLSIGPFSAS